MTASWYLVKYVEDPFRDEPKNVGVVVRGETDAAARFVGEQYGRFDLRGVRGVVSSTKTFAAWREYLLHHLYAGTFDSAMETLSGRSLDSYRVEWRGEINPPPEVGLDVAAEELFDELVTRPTSGPPSLERVVNGILFERLKVPTGRTIEKDVALPVDIKGEQHELEFDYRYINGRTSLMERVSLAGSPGQVTSRVHDTLFRVENVQPVLPYATFLVLYDSGRTGLTEESDKQLRLLNKFAHTVDARAGRAAERDVASVLGLELQS